MTLLYDEKGRMGIQLDVGRPTKLRTIRRQTDKDSRQSNWHLNRKRGREKTGHQSRLPVPNKAAAAGSTSFWLCPISLHHTWLVFIFRFWQPCLVLFLCNFYLGQRLLSCHVSPAIYTVYPGCHHRAWRRHTSGRSWTRDQEEVIHKVCGPSRGNRQIQDFISKLSSLNPSSINNILWETPTQLIA